VGSSLKAVLALAAAASLALVVVAPGQAAGAQGPRGAPGFSPLLTWQQAVSRPLRELPTAAAATGRPPRQLTSRKPGHGGGGTTDSSVQSSASTPLGATVTASFQGVGVPNYTPNSIPPDPNGSAGGTEFVETVNSDLIVFNKSGGIEFGV